MLKFIYIYIYMSHQYGKFKLIYRKLSYNDGNITNILKT